MAIIEYEGNDDVLVYKFPYTEFNIQSQLIVHESQEAVFLKDGQIVDTFPPGRYPLDMNKFSGLNQSIDLTFSGENLIHGEIYFVNKAVTMNYKWGTRSRTKVEDNKYKLFLEIGACGTLGLKVINPCKLLQKIAGSKPVLTGEACLEYFRERISASVKQYLARVMGKKEMSFILLEMYLIDFSAAVEGMLQVKFRDIGVELYDFVIGTIYIPEEQYKVVSRGKQDVQEAKYRQEIKLIEAQGDADAEVIRAKGRAERRRIEGYNWADEQIAEIMKLYAANVSIYQNQMDMAGQTPMALAFRNILREGAMTGENFSEGPLNFGLDDPLANVDPLIKAEDVLKPDNLTGFEDGFGPDVSFGFNLIVDTKPEVKEKEPVKTENEKTVRISFECYKKYRTLIPLSDHEIREYTAT